MNPFTGKMFCSPNLAYFTAQNTRNSGLLVCFLKNCLLQVILQHFSSTEVRLIWPFPNITFVTLSDRSLVKHLFDLTTVLFRFYFGFKKNISDISFKICMHNSEWIHQSMIKKKIKNHPFNYHVHRGDTLLNKMPLIYPKKFCFGIC